MAPGANELKVQLETRADLSFVEEQVRRSLPKDVAPAEAERFMAALGAVLRQNVQVDGVDWERLPADSGVEQVDAGLEARLADVQRETDELLVRVGALRRSVPEALAQELRTAVRDAEAQIEAAVAAEALPEEEGTRIADAELSPDQLDRLAGEIERLSQLGTSIPALVSKLQRAQALLQDAPRLAGAEEAAQCAEAEDEAAAQRRVVARQHEMAARLLSPV